MQVLDLHRRLVLKIVDCRDRILSEVPPEDVLNSIIFEYVALDQFQICGQDPCT